MCGQMKTLLDRLNPLYSSDYSFRDIYMIATAAENDESTFEKAYNGLQGWVDCFEKASLKGIVCGGGIDAANTAADHVDAMKKAYELGKEPKLRSSVASTWLAVFQRNYKAWYGEELNVPRWNDIKDKYDLITDKQKEKAEQSLAKAMDSLESALKKVADAQVQYEIWVNQ